MNYILFDEPETRLQLKPFTFIRPIAWIRVGILTIAEKWQKYLSTSGISALTEGYLQGKYPLKTENDNLLINSAVYPSPELIQEIMALTPQEALVKDQQVIACRLAPQNISYPIDKQLFTSLKEAASQVMRLTNLTDIFSHNGQQIREDFEIITRGRISQPIEDKHTIAYNPENIFLEEGVKLRACILNAENGPIYIGKNVQIHEGAIVKGALAICEDAEIRLGAKLRGDTTIGPGCKVGGEVSNSVFFGHSNKAHEGFLGNSVIGEWCNLGADTNTSNMKNNYNFVKIWNYAQKSFVDTGKQFCGLMMGDHSKSGINTMFNTGTVVGVNVNIFGGNFPPKFIPSFSWGGQENFVEYELSKALQVAERMVERRNLEFDEEDKKIMHEVYKRKLPFIVQKENSN